ncbi:hypothetical protein GCM10022419_131720 [Nonomuraea rosea]|uniref:Core-binding (CB) domain-containing protein n=1 Tax=Nonomuraea rosea TaxID=638574 RepID=A0ABP7A2P7_9ACTN
MGAARRPDQRDDCQETSENTDSVEPRRRGARSTPLPAAYEHLLADYTASLEQVLLAADTRRTSASRVRMYLAWLTERPATDARARNWPGASVRDYRLYLLREADPKRSVRYVNNALAALDDFPLRRGLGKAAIAREAAGLAKGWRDLPIEQIRELRRHKNLTAHLETLVGYLAHGPVRERLVTWTGDPIAPALTSPQ